MKYTTVTADTIVINDGTSLAMGVRQSRFAILSSRASQHRCDRPASTIPSQAPRLVAWSGSVTSRLAGRWKEGWKCLLLQGSHGPPDRVKSGDGHQGTCAGYMLDGSFRRTPRRADRQQPPFARCARPSNPTATSRSRGMGTRQTGTS